MDFGSSPLGSGAVAIESPVDDPSIRLSENPQSSKAAEYDDNKIFDSSLSVDSETTLKKKSTEHSSFQVDSAVENALALVYKLKEAVEKIPISFKNVEIKEQTIPSSSASEENCAIEIERLRKENEEIQQNMRSKQDQIMQLAEQYENASEQLNEKTKEFDELKSSLQLSSNFHDENSSSSISTVGASFSTMPSSSSEFAHRTDLSSHAPQSLPVFDTTQMSDVDVHKNYRELNNKAQSYRNTIKQLSDMNAQWKQYNGEKESLVKRLEESVKEQQIEIEHLKRQTLAGSDPNSITFSPAQQVFIDNAYQRLRLEADRYRDQQDTITQEAQRVVAQANEKQEEADRKIAQLQAKILELEESARRHTQRQEELQTALLVATRSSQQGTREQEIISSLREAARQYESDFQRISEDHRRVIRENNQLKDELARLRRLPLRPNVVQQTLVSEHPGGRTTMTRSSGGNFMIRNESSPGGDIEIDEYQRH